MSHSRIFEISRDKINEDKFCSPEDFLEFNEADSIRESREREDDLEWLQKYLGDAVEIKDDIITIIDSKDYFENKLSNFMSIIKNIYLDWTVSEFMDNRLVSDTMYELHREADDHYGFWIFYPDMGLITLDEFLRRVNAGDKFYIDGIMDYHW